MSPVRPARPPAIRYRPARRTDVENLADLGARAYRVHSVEKRRDFYTEHPRFGLRDVRVGELDGQIVASLVLYPLKGWVRGQLVPVTGIGSVAVYALALSVQLSVAAISFYQLVATASG